MRLLHQRHDHVGQGIARQETERHRGRSEGSAGRQSLPLRHPQPDRRRGAERRPRHGGRHGRPARRLHGREDLTMNAPILSRRSFAKGMGGIVLAFSLAPTDLLAQGEAARLPGSLQTNRKLDAWLRINADGTATVFTGKVELGQGILTALKQIAAEELDLPLVRISMMSGDTGRTPDEGQTAGSQSVENSGTALRMAGAEVRAILVGLAAKRLNAAADTLSVTDGTISAPDGRKVGYGELAGEVDLKREATAKIAPKAASRHTVVGRSVPRIDIPAKVTGGAAFVQDIRLPG